MGEYSDHNPPAFPHMATEGHRDYRPGMSLRDYFAGQALAGLLLVEEVRKNTYRHIASSAYFMADAMLTERAKGDQK